MCRSSAKPLKGVSAAAGSEGAECLCACFSSGGWMRAGPQSKPNLGRKLAVRSAFDVGSLESAVRQGGGQGGCQGDW